MTISPAGNIYNNQLITNSYNRMPMGQYDQDYLSLYTQLQNNSVFATINNPGIYTPQPAMPVPQIPGQEQQPQDENAGFFGGIWQTIKAPFKGAWEVVKSGGKFIGNVASGAWRATGGALGKLFTGHPFEAISECANGLLDVVKAPFQLGIDVVSDVGNFIADVADGVGDALGSLLPWNW